MNTSNVWQIFSARICNMLFVFDLDGTLLNTIEDLSNAVNCALRACSFPVRNLEECRQFVGNGVTKLLERSLPKEHQTPENLARMKEAFFAYYDAHLADFTCPYAGMVETLTVLQQNGVRLAVVSNKYQRATSALVTHFFPRVSFVAVQGQREGVPVKPHPYMVQEILQTAGQTRGQTLYVGDSDVDMQTAQNAGVKSCGVTWGFRPRESLAVYQPAYLIDKPEQLIEIAKSFG